MNGSEKIKFGWQMFLHLFFFGWIFLQANPYGYFLGQRAPQQVAQADGLEITTEEALREFNAQHKTRNGRKG